MSSPSSLADSVLAYVRTLSDPRTLPQALEIRDTLESMHAGATTADKATPLGKAIASLPPRDAMALNTLGKATDVICTCLQVLVPTASPSAVTRPPTTSKKPLVAMVPKVTPAASATAPDLLKQARATPPGPKREAFIAAHATALEKAVTGASTSALPTVAGDINKDRTGYLRNLLAVYADLPAYGSPVRAAFFAKHQHHIFEAYRLDQRDRRAAARRS